MRERIVQREDLKLREAGKVAVVGKPRLCSNPKSSESNVHANLRAPLSRASVLSVLLEVANGAQHRHREAV